MPGEGLDRSWILAAGIAVRSITTRPAKSLTCIGQASVDGRLPRQGLTLRPYRRDDPNPADVPAPMRTRGEDEFAHPLPVFINEEDPGTPSRCCLREAAVGEAGALIVWRV